eukprot:44322_1
MTMTTLKSISISTTTNSDNEKEATIPCYQYSVTPTDNFNLCYTPTSVIHDENVICNVISNIETSQNIQITPNKTKICKISPIKNTSPPQNNNSNEAILPMTDRHTKRFLSPQEEQTETLSAHGYKKHELICKTLQGKLFAAKSLNNNNEIVVIKTANIKLHQQGVAIDAKGRKFNVKENIVKEARIMEKFMDNNPPNTCIKFHKFFSDTNQFYLVMEKGGQGLFEFVVKCHKLIHEKRLSLKKWRKNVKYMFYKMAKFIHWLHNQMHCAHLDISLENVVTGEDTFFDEKTGEIKNLDVRFIDYGLTECFDMKENPTFKCTQFVGKNGYKSPQIFEKKIFSANKADIWALGVSLFMMLIGAPPYQIPNGFDAAFILIKNNRIKDLLRNWNRLNYVSENMIDLLSKMLCYDEIKRIDIDGVCNHIWFKDMS